MFRNAKVGDRVFDYTSQSWGTIYNISETKLNGLDVKLDSKITLSYAMNGKISVYDNVPVLFWDEVKPIIPPKKPLPKIKLDTRVLVWDDDNEEKHARYFSHFNKNGYIVTFPNGQTSWTYNLLEMKECWENYKTVD